MARHAYTGVVAAAIRAAKLEGCWAAWRPFGLALGQTVADAGWSDIDVVTGVPADPRRRRRRGFDHAALLAAGVAETLGRPDPTLLAAVGSSPDRGAAAGRRVDANQPQSDPRVATKVPAVVAVGHCTGHVLLVDDIITTGHTVALAAAALRAGGANRVSVAAIARAGGH